jgi:hypothetical protein
MVADRLLLAQSRQWYTHMDMQEYGTSIGINYQFNPTTFSKREGTQVCHFSMVYNSNFLSLT